MTQWSYERRTGALDHDSVMVGTGYSGHGAGLNNPAAERLVGVGPLPAGTYGIGPFFDHPHLGPIVSHLTPISGPMFGRSGFFIHGDTAAMNHTASDGCIILSRPLREAVRDSKDRVLVVI